MPNYCGCSTFIEPRWHLSPFYPTVADLPEHEGSKTSLPVDKLSWFDGDTNVEVGFSGHPSPNCDKFWNVLMPSSQNPSPLARDRLLSSAQSPRQSDGCCQLCCLTSGSKQQLPGIATWFPAARWISEARGELPNEKTLEVGFFLCCVGGRQSCWEGATGRSSRPR